MPLVTAADGVNIVVHDLGGRGQPLVLAHATGFHGRVWAPLAEEMCDAFHCISFDARGHGDSRVAAGHSFDWRGFALDALAVVTGLGLERPVGFGHSSGGTGLLLAEATRPGTFAALYCFEPVIVPADPPLGRDPDNWLSVAVRRRRVLFSSRREALEAYSAKPPLSVLDPRVLSEYVEHGLSDLDDGSVRLKCRPEDEALIYEMATAHDCFSRLGQVKCPVAVACGQLSEGLGPSCCGDQVGLLPHGQLEVLPGLDHLGPLQDPAAVAHALRRFFGGL